MPILQVGRGGDNPYPRRLGGAAGEGRVKEMAKYGEIGLKGSYRFLNEGFLSPYRFLNRFLTDS